VDWKAEYWVRFTAYRASYVTDGHLYRTSAQWRRVTALSSTDRAHSGRCV